MSLHKSLKGASNLGGTRNVLNRVQRIKLLKERGLWKEGDKVTGLPKEKIIRLKKIKVEKKEEKKEVEETKEATDWKELRK